MAPLSHLWERGWGRGLKTLQNCQFSPLPNPLPGGARGLIAFDRFLCEQHYGLRPGFFDIERSERFGSLFLVGVVQHLDQAIFQFETFVQQLTKAIEFGNQ